MFTAARVGITFAVYGEEAGTERLIPFDVIPRIIPADEWERSSAACVQRVKALNRFLPTSTTARRSSKAGLIPREQVLATPSYRPEMMGVDLSRATSTRTSPASTSCARTATALLRAGGQPARAQRRELHARNRKMMMRLFPELFSRTRWRRSRTTPTCCWKPCAPAPRPASTTRRWWC
jgi:uncharacterized circularly permuted ATP-grasp superfamily protein